MTHTRKPLVLLTLACLGFAGFDRARDKDARLQAIADEYTTYTQLTRNELVITDSSKFKWTVRLCSIPDPDDSLYGFHYKQHNSFISKADEALSPHGNKLYRLYIKDYRSYIGLQKLQPIGQVIVKETWNVKEIAYDSLDTNLIQIQSRNDDKWYTPTTVSEVFIMYKEKKSKSNDEGWNYGNVSIEDKNRGPVLLNDRKLSNCIGCHINTKYDRIFRIR